MKRQNHKKSAEWQGYTLDQIAHRRAINAVKQEMTMEQIATVYSQIASGRLVNTPQNSASAPNDFISRLSGGLSKFMSYASYGVKAISIIRSVRKVIAGFRN